MVDKNHGDSDRLKKMLPDSQIAGKYPKKKQNPNILFNLVSLSLFKMN